MEPVPETERMEEFRSSPVPSLRLATANNLNATLSLDVDVVKKPVALRRSTDPSPASPSSSSWSSMHATGGLPYRPRTASPLSGAHSRSRSAAGLAPAMSRTQSMPGVNGSGHLLYSPQLRPSSPSGSPNRARTPRKPVDDAFPMSPVRTSVLEPDRNPPERSSSPSFGVPGISSARLRRPSSPFRNVPPPSGGLLSVLPSTPSSNSSASSYKAYDSFYGSYGGNLSSVPSTPTSARSRSPSISSLETIPDSPDAEQAALEAERVSQSKTGAEADGNANSNSAAGSSDSSDAKGRGSPDVPARGRTLGFGSRDKRKRWSVCGAERRGDLDLETIWED